MIKFVHIVARSANGIIGNNGDIPWKLSKDLAYFKEKTTNNICIVGRKTYEGIKHLKNRTFVVVTKSQNLENIENAFFVNSILDAIEKSKQIFNPTTMQCVYIIGGSEIYKQTFDIVSCLYVTEIEKSFDGDSTYFVPDNFKLHNASSLHSENKIPFYFATYVKK